MPRWVKRRSLKVLAPATAVTLLMTLPSGCYVTRQALVFNDMYNSRRSIDEVLADAATPSDVKANLVIVRGVMTFAKRQGLNVETAYRYYINNRDTGVSYVVQAAPADNLTFLTWWFPFVGSVPYLGYFDKSERDAKAAELKADGKDVHTGTVGAFSSLGWFEDPIYASMLGTSEHDVVHLFLHELTHRSFWSRGSVTMNENLAEYVAYYLTVKYLEEKKRTDDLKKYRAEQSDKVVYRDWLEKLKKELEVLYGNSAALERGPLLAKKKEIFSRYLGPDKPRFTSSRYEYVAKREWNNATVLAAGLYAPDMARFERAHRCTGFAKIGDFLARLKVAEEAQPDAFSALDSLCSPAGGPPNVD